MKRLKIVAPFLLAAGLLTGAALRASAAQSLTPIPKSVPQCTSGQDATSLLNTFFAGLGPNTQVTFPPGSCYLVGNTTTYLKVAGTTDLSIDGNGATLQQTTYPAGTNDPVIPILDAENNTDLKVSNLTVDGPGNGSGASNEGDYGIRLIGNSGAAFDAVTIENTDGDGFAVYPSSNTSGINTNVILAGSTEQNIGYHGVTPEGVNGLYLLGDSFSGVGNFMDLEVDSPCTAANGWCLVNGQPVGAAQWNVWVVGSKFTNGLGGNWVESEQAACIPQDKLIFEDDQLDSTVPNHIVLLGTRSTSCPAGTDSNVTISNVTAPSNTGATTSPFVEINDYSGVTLSSNDFTGWVGTQTYDPDHLFVPEGASLCGDTGVQLGGNFWNNSIALDSTTGCWDWDSGEPATSGLTDCGNTWGLTQPIINYVDTTDTVTAGSITVQAPNASSKYLNELAFASNGTATTAPGTTVTAYTLYHTLTLSQAAGGTGTSSTLSFEPQPAPQTDGSC